jgi:hypothetical protein
MKKKLSCFISVITAFLLISCHATKSSRFGFSKKTTADTIQNLEQGASTDLIVFKAPNQKNYFARHITADQLVESLPMAMASPVTEANDDGPATTSTTDSDPVKEKFRGGLGGGVREEAKTTFTAGSFKKKTLRWLVTKLPDNAAMESYNLGQDSPRCQPEKMNIHVKKAWLYVFKHEDDKDYHLLIGDKDDYTKANHIFNAEISALPVNFTKDLEQLEKVRRKAIDFLKSKKPCNTIEYILSIPIEIKGSLFYDYHHKSETAKCKSVQSQSAWELHPVYDVVFK